MRRLYRLLLLGRMVERALQSPSTEAWLEDGGGRGYFRDPAYVPPAGRYLRVDDSFALTPAQTRLVRSLLDGGSA